MTYFTPTTGRSGMIPHQPAADKTDSVLKQPSFKKVLNHNLTLNPNGKKVIKTDTSNPGTHLDTARGAINEGNPNLAKPVPKQAPAEPSLYARMLAKKSVSPVTAATGMVIVPVGGPRVGPGGAIYTESDLQVAKSGVSVRTLKKS